MSSPRVARICAIACAAAFAIGLPGCGSSGGSSPVIVDPVTADVQQASAADTVINQAIGAANELLLQTTTVAGSSGISTKGLGLRSITPGTAYLVDYATLTDVAGNRIYPTSTGQFHVSTDGAVVSSWPLASNQMGTHVVTIVFDAGPVSYLDPDSGVTATIAAGTLVHNLASSYTYASTDNWTLDLDGTTTIAAGTPFPVSVTRIGAAAVTAAVSGQRQSHILVTRVNTAPTINYRQVDTTISGDALGVDALNPTQGYAHLIQTLGANTLLIQRFAQITWKWDFAGTTPAFSVPAFTDQIYVARNAAALTGSPFTLATLRTTFRLRSTSASE
ncbi:MAG: hypothetical protein H0W83_15660 [Planctomycetes bacterium]|nr:hypothetical protein [Planctomycetota bacterium]